MTWSARARILAAVIAAPLALSLQAHAKTRPVPDVKSLGKAVDCIAITQIRESRVRSDSIIDFRVGSKRWYRNTLPQSCPSLRYEERFSYSTSLSQLCSVDTIAVLHAYAGGLHEGARCGLGKFEPVELVEKPRK